MNRASFEMLRDLPGKTIEGDIRFIARQAARPLLTTEELRITNSPGVDVRLNITHNPQIGSTTFNVHVPGLGPICRLDVDGQVHRPCGRTHKHSLQSEQCPDRNLPDGVIDRPDLSSRPVEVLFTAFCEMARITHDGVFYAPGTSR